MADCVSSLRFLRDPLEREELSPSTVEGGADVTGVMGAEVATEVVRVVLRE